MEVFASQYLIPSSEQLKHRQDRPHSPLTHRKEPPLTNWHLLQRYKRSNSLLLATAKHHREALEAHYSVILREHRDFAGPTLWMAHNGVHVEKHLVLERGAALVARLFGNLRKPGALVLLRAHVDAVHRLVGSLHR